MEKIKITEDLSEIIKIGKCLCQSMPEIYSPHVLAGINDTINKYMYDASMREKEDTLYRSIYDYWVYGNIISEEFYMKLFEKTRDERNEYIAFRWRMKYLKEINDPQFEYLFRNKFNAFNTFKEYYRRDVIELSCENDKLKFYEFIEKHPLFIAKPASLSYGIGVEKINSEEYEDTDALFYKLLNHGVDIVKNINWKKANTVVLEEPIVQVDELAAIHPYSVNGIRISTLRIGNDVHILYPWFKIGADKNPISREGYGFTAGIDSETGIVNTDGFIENGESLPTHPLTNLTFKGYQIPKWQELIDTVKELSWKVPNVRFTGWDMVLTPKGWTIIEANYTGEYLWQMYYKKGWRKEFEALTGWKQNTEFWWE